MTDRDLIKEMLNVWDNRVRWKLGEVVEKMRAQLTTPEPTHTCSYFCSKTECIKAQRDELRDLLARDSKYSPTISRAAGDKPISWLTSKGRA